MNPECIANKSNIFVVDYFCSCNECQQCPLQGPRFKCRLCDDYDLCETCFNANRNNHRHPFTGIPEPGSTGMLLISYIIIIYIFIHYGNIIVIVI